MFLKNSFFSTQTPESIIFHEVPRKFVNAKALPADGNLLRSVYTKLPISLTHPPTWSTLPAQLDLTGILLSLPRTYSHFHTGTWHILPCRPAGPLHCPSLFRSLPNWICPRMPEVNEAISNGKLSRQLGRIWVADKNHLISL